MVGVCLCLIKTRLSRRERLFCMIAYTPKATVQAAIGGVPLAMGLAWGNCFDSCSGCDTYYSSAGSIFHRSDI